MENLLDGSSVPGVIVGSVVSRSITSQIPLHINWHSKSLNSIVMSDYKTLLRDAISWLKENTLEIAAVAARI